MDIRYWFRYIAGVYAWFLGFYVLLLVVLAELHREGVQANYKQFLLLWAALLLLSPFFMGKYGNGLPDSKLLFPRFSMAAGALLTIGLYIVTSVIAVSILFWVENTVGF